MESSSNKSMNSTKVYIIGALIITVSLVIIGVSMSYAYFVNRVEEVRPTNQGVDVTSGDLTLRFDNENMKYINATAAGLVNDSEILSKAEYTQFSIIFPNDSKSANASYNIFLTDTQMTKNFKSTDLKWALYKADSNGDYAPVTGASGDFSNVVGIPDAAASGTMYPVNDISILGSTDIARGTTVSYKLYVWLSNNPTEQQNSLLQGKLSTKVAFRAVAK